MAEHVIQGIAIKLQHRIDVADESGRVLLTLPFRDAITVLD